MKKMLVAIALMLMFMCLCTVAFAADGFVTMYALDGRSISVAEGAVDAWKNVGWYDYPVTMMYSPDGRTAVVYSGSVVEWKSVGWYDYPVTTMYAADGRTAVIYSGAVEEWKKAGWYDHPVAYVPDANTISFYENGQWMNQGMTVSFKYKYDNVFEVIISVYEERWVLFAELNENGVFTYSNGIKYRLYPSGSFVEATNQSGIIELRNNYDPYWNDGGYHLYWSGGVYDSIFYHYSYLLGI